jgi:excisionase family DNA binding protein
MERNEPERSMSDPLYSLRQVADFTGTPIDTVRRWVLEGRIEVERVGPLRLKRVRVKQSVLLALFPHVEKLLNLPDNSSPSA